MHIIWWWTDSNDWKAEWTQIGFHEILLINVANVIMSVLCPASLKLPLLVLCTYPGFGVHLLLRAGTWNLLQRASLEPVELLPHTNTHAHICTHMHIHAHNAHTCAHTAGGVWGLSTLHSLLSTPPWLLTDWFRSRKAHSLAFRLDQLCGIIDQFSVGSVV